jgi:NADH-quinone oxidoreductase subunit H
MIDLILPYFGIITWDNVWYVTRVVFAILLISLPLFGAVAYLTWAERKVIGWMQLRHGPCHVGPFGLGQPLADAVKLMFKEMNIPAMSDKVVFFLAPAMLLIPSLAAWAVIPFSTKLVLADINLGVMYLMAISSLSVYGILMAGWASNSKYAFLGAVRSGAQMVSYEVSMGLCLLSVILMAGSMNLNDIIEAQRGMWYVIPAFPMFIVFLVSILAETNRAPFDLPEAEAELVAGYNVEYGSMSFAVFFLSEYMAMITMSAMAAILFLGGWLPPLDIAPLNMIPGMFWLFGKTAAILFFFIWARATFPRYRYDQLMRLGWKIFLPFCLFWLILTAFYLKLAGGAM